MKKLLSVFILVFPLTLFAQQPKLVLPIGHTNRVIGFKITPNEKYLVTASEDKTAKIWNYRTGKFLYDLKVHNSYLTDMDMSKDGSFVVLASADGTYSKWSVESGELLFRSQPKASIRQIFLLPGDSSVLLVKDYVMVIGFLKNDEPDILFDEITSYYNDDKIKKIAFSPDFSTIAIHQKNHALNIYNLSNELYQNTHSFDKIDIDTTKYYDLEKQTPDFLYFTSNNEIIASYNGGMMVGYNIDSNKQTFFYPKTVKEVVLNADRTIMAFKNYNNDTIRIWDTRLKKITASISNPKKLSVVTFSEKSKNLILHSKNTIQEWSLTGHMIKESKLNQSVSSIISLNKHETTAVAGIENGIQTVHWKTGKVINEFVGKITEVKNALISKDGFLLFEIKKSYSNYWDLQQMSSNRFPELDDNPVKQIFLTNIANRVILQYPDFFSLFDCNSGQTIYTKAGSEIMMLPGDSTFITVDKKNITTWIVTTGEPSLSLTMPERVNHLSVSADGTHLAYNTNERNNDSIFIWNIKEERKIASIYRPSQYIESGFFVIYSSNYTPAFRFSQDNKYLFFSSGENGWLSIVRLPYEEYHKYDEFTDTVRFEAEMVYEEGILEYYSEINPIALIENQKIVLMSCQIEGADYVIKGFDFTNQQIEIQLESTEFQRIIFYDSVKNHLFTATKSETLEWDLVTQKLIHRWQLPAGMRTLAILENKKQILIVSNDRIAIQFMDSIKPIYFFSTLDQNESVAYRNDGYYKVSPDAVSSLSWNINEKFYDFDQWDLRYNRPDKILEFLKAENDVLVTAYHNAYLKRLRKNNLTHKVIEQTLKLPQLEIINKIEDGDILTDSIINLKIKVTPSDKKYEVTKIFISVNGCPVFGKKGFSTTLAIDTIVELPVKLSEELNSFKISCVDNSGNESLREQFQILYKPTTNYVKQTHFIGIGINQFENTDYNLNWSVKDIRDLAINLKEKYGNNIVIDTLFNQNVNTENIKKLKQQLEKTSVNDKVIISYSGHGMLSKDYDYYLSTYAVNFQKPEENGLPYDELENLLDSIPARKKLMLIDACHSGEVDKEEGIAMNKIADSLGLSKGIIIEGSSTQTQQLGLKSSFELMQSLFVNVGKSTGATIISAAAGNQFALERGDLKNGVFTYSILEAMEKNPTMKISELKKIVGERVEQLTNGMQKPTSRNETIAVDWGVW